MSDKKKWLVMLYVASDDKPDIRPGGTLTNECGTMLRKLENAAVDGSIDLCDVAVVALTDSPFDTEAAAKKDKENAGQETTYAYMTPGVKELREDGWSKINAASEPARILYNVRGETKINSGSYKTLANFMQWALNTYAAENTMLSIIGHGGGWSPGFPQVEPKLFAATTFPSVFFKKGHLAFRVGSDQERTDTRAYGDPDWQTKKGGNVSPAIEGLCPDYSPATDNIFHVAMSTRGLGAALEEGIKGQPKKLDVLFLDACLMSMVEVAYEIKDYVDYLVAGEDLLYARFPYNLYLRGVEKNTPDQLARLIVNLYNEDDPKHPPARPQDQKSWAIAATNLARVSQLRDDINSMAESLLKAIDLFEKDQPKNELQEAIFHAYDECQKFDYDGDLDIDQATEGYVDLFDFAEHLSKCLNEFTLDRNNEVFRASIQSAQRSAGEIQCIIGKRLPAASPADANLEGVLFVSGSLDNVILNSRAQTERKSKRNLRQAHGISIYLPLGEPDNRQKADPADRDEGDLELEKLFLNKRYLDFYGEQLKFTNQNGDRNPNNHDLTPWANLVKRLVAARIPTGEPRAGLLPPSYSTPRQILPDY